jgi:hypothetical protein
MRSTNRGPTVLTGVGSDGPKREYARSASSNGVRCNRREALESHRRIKRGGAPGAGIFESMKRLSQRAQR